MNGKDPTVAAALGNIDKALRVLADFNPVAAASIAEAVSSLKSDKYKAEDDSCQNATEPGWPKANGAEDLSVLVAPELPCTWPSGYLPSLVIMRYIKRGLEPYVSEAIVIDEHTATHWDAPPHFHPPTSSGLPNASVFGNLPSHDVPVWQFVGEACVVDATDLLDKPGPGESDITQERLEEWEAENRQLGPGDMVLLHSGYSDKYYRPFPEGRRYVAEPLQGSAPGWPGADPKCMDFLVSRKVNSVGTDAPNIGPASPVAIDTHVEGLEGMIIFENLTRLGTLSTTGAFFALLGPKHADGSGGEARAIAVTEPELAARLIRSARLQQVADLSVLMRDDLPVSWPGRGVPSYRMPYTSKTLHTWDQPGGPALVRTHLLDTHTGTHLVPPAYAVPEPDFDRGRYDDATRQALQLFEQQFGALGTSTATADKVPVSQLSGPARVIDVQHLLGTADPQPGSPKIRVSDIQRHEKLYGPIQPCEIVIFHSGHSDRFFKPFPHGTRCFSDPLNGLAEGWPAPTPKAILYLVERGVRCVGTDAPRMGSVDPTEALLTYWAGGSRNACFVEYLTGVGQLPPVGAYFLFAPVKIRGTHGGHGRALALF